MLWVKFTVILQCSLYIYPRMAEHKGTKYSATLYYILPVDCRLNDPIAFEDEDRG